MRQVEGARIYRILRGASSSGRTLPVESRRSPDGETVAWIDQGGVPVIHPAPARSTVPEASFARPYGGLGTVSHPQFVEDVGDVIADRFYADSQLGGDGRMREAHGLVADEIVEVKEGI